MPELLTAKRLREERLPMAKEIRRLADLANNEKREFTAEEQAAWEKVNADYNAQSKLIERAERADLVEEEQVLRITDRRHGRDDFDTRRLRIAGDGLDGVSGLPHEQAERCRTLAMAAWMRAPSLRNKGREISEEEQHACKAVGLNPHGEGLEFRLLPTQAYRRLQRDFNRKHQDHRGELAEIPLPEYGAQMSSQAGPAGAYMIPPETLLRKLEINMLYYGGMRQVSESIRTASGERMSWPTANDVSNMGVQLGDSAAAMPPAGNANNPSNTSLGTEVDPTFGKVFWDAYKFSSNAVLVPYELLEDSIFDIPSLLGELLGIRLGRITNLKFTTGTGASTPKGLVTCANPFAAASATSIAADDLLNLIHSIDPAYRTQQCGFMMHDQILLIIRKLKNSFGEYIWQSGLQAGVPDKLLSYGLTVNQQMASAVAANALTVIFGLLSHYKIRTVGNIRLYRLQERYRDTDQDGFIALLREDGNLLDAGTHPVAVLQQAA